MATENYNPVPTVAPQEQAPNDTLRVNPTPAAFGGALAQGAEQLGAGASKAGQFFGQVAADQASNNFQQQASEIVTNYKSLRGQAAIDAKPQVQKSIDDLLNSTRQSLSTPQQNLQFDDFSRRYRTYLDQDIGSHFDQQTQVWMKGVHDESIKVNLGDIATNPTDPEHVANASKNVIDAYVNNARLQGLPEDAAVLQGKQAAATTQIQSIAATDPDKALRMVDNYKSILGVQYAPLRERISTRADQQFGVAQANAYGAQAVTDIAARGPGPVEDPAQMLRGFEKFRAQPYWDVNHWRVGYGSDTITRADGSVEPVTSFTQVSPADAERDLQRRTQQTQQQLQTAIGPAWQQLPAGTQASLTSLTYNYGYVPPTVAAAAQTGDANTIAQSILSLRGANGGVNASRRTQEASNVLGSFKGPGGDVLPFGGADAQLPGGQNAPAIPAPDLPIVPASFTQEAGVIPPSLPLPPSPPPVASPGETYAGQVRAIQQDPQLQARPRAMAAAMQQAHETFAAAQIAAEADARGQKERADQAVLGYSDSIAQFNAGKLPPDQQQALIPSIYANHALSIEQKNALSSAVTRAAGGATDASYGPAYTQVLAGITAPYGSVNRVSTPDQIIQLYASGGLSAKGRDDTLKMLGDVKRSPDTAGVVQSRSAVLNGYKSRMTYDSTPPFPGMSVPPDREGTAAFDEKFVPAFNSMFDKYVAAGGDPYSFMLDSKNVKQVDALAEQIRPKTQVDAARVSALGEATGGEAVTPQAIPAPPSQDVDPDAWKSLVSRPPLIGAGKQATYAQWGEVLKRLQDDPSSETKAAFNKRFGAGGATADQVLDQLTPKQQEPPPPPGPSLHDRLADFGDWLHSRPLEPKAQP